MPKTGKKDQKHEKKVLLRLPVKIAKEVERRAAESHRSFNGQIVFELDQKAA